LTGEVRAALTRRWPLSEMAIPGMPTSQTVTHYLLTHPLLVGLGLVLLWRALGPRWASRKARPLREAQLAKPADVEISIYRFQEEHSKHLMHLLLFLGALVALTLVGRVPLNIAIYVGGPISCYYLIRWLTAGRIAGPFSPRKAPRPVIWLSPAGYQIEGAGRALWPQLNSAKTVIVGHGKYRRPYLALSFRGEGPTGNLTGQVSARMAEHVKGVREGDFLVDISYLEPWANPETVLALMHKRMEASEGAPRAGGAHGDPAGQV